MDASLASLVTESGIFVPEMERVVALEPDVGASDRTAVGELLQDEFGDVYFADQQAVVDRIEQRYAHLDLPDVDPARVSPEFRIRPTSTDPSLEDLDIASMRGVSAVIDVVDVVSEQLRSTTVADVLVVPWLAPPRQVIVFLNPDAEPVEADQISDLLGAEVGEIEFFDQAASFEEFTDMGLAPAGSVDRSELPSSFRGILFLSDTRFLDELEEFPQVLQVVTERTTSFDTHLAVVNELHHRGMLDHAQLQPEASRLLESLHQGLLELPFYASMPPDDRSGLPAERMTQLRADAASLVEYAAKKCELTLPVNENPTIELPL